MVTKRQTASEKAKSVEEAGKVVLVDEKVGLLESLQSRYGAPRQGRGKDGKLLAFIRHEDEIRQALDLGYTVKEVWEHMCELGLITASYNTFAGHVRTRLGITSGRIRKDASPVSAVEPELAGSEGREIDERVHELVGKSVGKPAGKPAEKPAADPHAGIKFGAGAGQKPFNPSGG